MAPILTTPPPTVMPLSSAIAPRSASASGAARPSFIDGSRLCPPAINLAPAAAALAASATVAGLL
jgi:hypothetical protein